MVGARRLVTICVPTLFCCIIGPCNIDIRGTRSNGTVWNRYSWNNEANIFFLDQPSVGHLLKFDSLTCRNSAGVGFSYSETGHTVGSTKVAAKDVAQFIDIFFDTFKQFEGRPLHLAGESYGVSSFAIQSSV